MVLIPILKMLVLIILIHFNCYIDIRMAIINLYFFRRKAFQTLFKQVVISLANLNSEYSNRQVLVSIRARYSNIHLKIKMQSLIEITNRTNILAR